VEFQLTKSNGPEFDGGCELLLRLRLGDVRAHRPDKLVRVFAGGSGGGLTGSVASEQHRPRDATAVHVNQIGVARQAEVLPPVQMDVNHRNLPAGRILGQGSQGGSQRGAASQHAGESIAFRRPERGLTVPGSAC
jgi:hypothetical protein